MNGTNLDTGLATPMIAVSDFGQLVLTDLPVYPDVTDPHNIRPFGVVLGSGELFLWNGDYNSPDVNIYHYRNELNNAP